MQSQSQKIGCSMTLWFTISSYLFRKSPQVRTQRVVSWFRKISVIKTGLCPSAPWAMRLSDVLPSPLKADDCLPQANPLPAKLAEISVKWLQTELHSWRSFHTHRSEVTVLSSYNFFLVLWTQMGKFIFILFKWNLVYWAHLPWLSQSCFYNLSSLLS
jgi:hypothetical protein